MKKVCTIPSKRSLGYGLLLIQAPAPIPDSKYLIFAITWRFDFIISD
jgi:hypothetical protein